MTTVAELTRPLSIAECRDAIYATLAARGTDVTTWKPGAVARTIIYAFAIVCAAFSQLQALLAGSSFLDTASGPWLTLVARLVYGVERLPGASAAGDVVFDNTGAGVYSGDPGDLILVSDDGFEYRNVAPFSIAAFATDVVIPMRAVELGSAPTAGAGELTTFVTPLSGVTASNAAALVGADPETDAQLRARCRDKLGTLSPNGPKDAYFFAAKSARRAVDGSDVGVTRVHAVPDGAGSIDVYVATATGGVTGDANDPDTDLGAVALAIHRRAEPLSIDAVVQSASTLTVAVTYEAWVRESSLSNEQLEDGVEDALAAWMATIPIGGQILPSTPGSVFVSAVQGAITSALERLTGEPPIRVEVSAPATDVVVASNQAPALGAVTATIHQIAENG